MVKKSIEETFQKMSPRDHVLKRPQTYVGSVGMQSTKVWVMPTGGTQFEYREINYVPALYKIFDEVLVNAADNYQRDNNMNTMKVQIDREQGFVSISNNGKGIPVQIHKEYKIYVPELIFGHLLTGSNYDDEEKRVVGGRNGYGAKLANIFSKKFIVQCGDQNKKKKFKMIWSNNMDTHTEAEITEGYSGKDFTTITFYPDFKRFKMQGFDEDIYSLFTKRAYDMAGVMPKVKVLINGKDVTVNSFVKYVNLYFDPDSEAPKVRDDSVDTDRWQVVVSTSDGQFKQVSFVNSICTSRGGSHVDYITNQLVAKIQQKIKKKDKNLEVKPFQIKNHLWIFVNCLIVNPTFDSQTKQTLKLKVSDFGSECVLSDKMIKTFLSSGVVDEIFNQAKAKQMGKLKGLTGKKTQRIQGIPKLDDANQAGGRNSEKCTLILTEGDSAKALAMAGLEVIGRDFYGVFPLRGKLLNVREANSKTILKNQQIQSLIKIMGLQIAKSYSDLKSLRYGSIMIMSDQDTDGSHIKGLVINFVHHFWPSLFKIDGFMKQFITPLLKATKSKDVKPFFTMAKFKNWYESQQNPKQWKIKYYKGLGTSTDKEAKQYFERITTHKFDFKYLDQHDDASFDLIFSKKNADKRKQWLEQYDPNVSMDYDRPSIRYKEFVDKQFIHFSNEDNSRSIASIIDGFKPGQRKIIYACFKRNLKEQIKVAQLAGYVAEHSAYHHGQMSLTQTIVGMAQNFVGSNNINLLMPNGQFGSRNAGGKDHASARYIFTCLNKITRYIYPEPDDHVLTYVQDDGQFVEPEFYIPIIPMGLVNGCDGIGTGWSTNVPNFNPRELASMIMERLEKNQPFRDIHPWYKGFVGEIIEKPDLTSYDIKGIIQIDSEASLIHIKQLPVGKWIKDHKENIENLMKEDDRIIGFREYHTRQSVHFEIEMNSETIQKHSDDTEYFAKLFKTNASLSMKNVVGFNESKKLHRYTRISEVMEEFYSIRLRYYQLRKSYLLSRLERQLLILSNKERFILEIIQEKLVIKNMRKVKICQTLRERGYTKFSDFPKIKSTKSQGKKKEVGEGEGGEGENEDDEQGNQKKDSVTDYNYLLTLPLLSLTFEKVEQIKRQKAQKKNEFDTLQMLSIRQIWKSDIVEFLKVLDNVEQQEKQQQLEAQQKVKHDGKMKKNRKKADKVVKKAKKDGTINWESQSDTSVQNNKAKKGDGGKKKKNNDEENKNNSTQEKEKPQKAKKKQPKKEKEKEKEKVKSDDDDFMKRINNKLSQSKSKQSQSSLAKVTLVQQKSKLQNCSQVLDKQESDYEMKQGFINSSKSKKGTVSKSKSKSSQKKRNIDSDESDESDESFSNADIEQLSDD